MSPAAVLGATGLTCLLLAVVLGAGARELTDSFEARHRLQAVAVVLGVAAIWCFAVAGGR